MFGPHISHFRSQEPSPTTHAQKRLLAGQRGVMSRGVLPRYLFGTVQLGYQICAHTWEDPEIHKIWIMDQANQDDWPKDNQKK